MNRITQATEQPSVGVGIPTKATFQNENRKNNRIFARRPLTAVRGMAIALTLVLAAAHAQSISENFAYSSGPISGQNGGTGWAGPWAGSGDNVVSPGVTVVCNGQLPSGNALGPTSGPATTRTFATPITGTPGTSMVLSAVINSNVDGAAFTQATLGNSSGGTFIIGELPETSQQAANWALQNSAGKYYSTKPVVTNAQTCLVAQIDFSVKGGLDRMRMWVNPPPSLPLGKADVDVTTAHVAVFSGVFWQTQQGQIVDEISVSSAGGTWTKITNQFPGSKSDTALLLTDGSVLVQDGYSRRNWYKLTPDIYGSYINGTWTQVASIPASWNYAPQLFASAVLPDGRAIVMGGEHNKYPNGGIYDPVADTWSFVSAPGFGDSCGTNGTSWCAMGGAPSVVLPDGTFMIGNAAGEPAARSQALLPPPYDPAIHPWIPTGPQKHDPNSEEGWTLLPSPPGAPDLSLVLTVDTYAHVTTPVCGGFHNSELYAKGSYAGFQFPGDWYCWGDTPDQLYPNGVNEIGPAVLRPDGTVFQTGATLSTPPSSALI